MLNIGRGLYEPHTICHFVILGQHYITVLMFAATGWLVLYGNLHLKAQR